MKFEFQRLILLLLIFSVSGALAFGETTRKFYYKPIVIPVTIKVDRDFKVTFHLTREIRIPSVGIFGLETEVEAFDPSCDKDNDLIVEIKTAKDYHVFVINSADSLNVESSGLTKTTISKNRVRINLTDAELKKLTISPIIPTEQLEIGFKIFAGTDEEIDGLYEGMGHKGKPHGLGVITTKVKKRGTIKYFSNFYAGRPHERGLKVQYEQGRKPLGNCEIFMVKNGVFVSKSNAGLIHGELFRGKGGRDIYYFGEQRDGSPYAVGACFFFGKPNEISYGIFENIDQVSPGITIFPRVSKWVWGIGDEIIELK